MIPTSPISADTGRSADELSELLHLVYGAASNADRWPSVLQAVAASLHGRSSMLFTPYLRPQEKGMYHALDITPEQSMLWAAKYLELDLWTNQALEQGLVKQGAVITDADTATLITTHRPMSAPPFSQQDRNWLNLLLPHLARSLELSHRIQGTQLLQRSLLSALNSLSWGVLLLNAAGQLIHANTAARQVLSREDGLACTPTGQLAAQPLRAGQPGLADWLQAQSNLLMPDVLHFSDAFLVKRTDTDQVYCIQCCPVDNASIWHRHTPGQSVACVVFVSNPAALILPTADRLKRLYGLTEAETNVSHQLANGLSTKETAKALGTSPETVRTQVKNIYQKMRVNSQSELVRTLLTLGQASV